MFKRPLFQRFFVVFVLLGFTIGYSIYQRNVYSNLTTISAPVLRTLPKFNFVDLYTEKVFSTSKLLEKSNGLIVHFWGTWCGPCTIELPELLRFSQKLAEKNITLLLVDVTDSKKKAKKFLKKFRKYFSSNVIMAFDNEGSSMPLFGTSKVPETFIFNSKGKHLKKYIGAQDWTQSTYLSQILKYLKL